MGNFYCNFTTRGPSARDVVRVLSEGRRTAYVTPTFNSHTVVFEKATDQLDETTIDRLGALLSGQLACPVLAAVVADEDLLWLALYESGNRTAEYSSRGANRGARAICRAFGRPWKTPWVWLLLQWPYLVFESLRHLLLVKSLGLPAWSVGAGYGYIKDGELPQGLTMEDLHQT